MITRLWAAKELAKITGSSKEAAVTALTNVLASDSFYAVRMAAAQSLGELGTDPAKTALLSALKQPDSHVRTAAIEAIGHSSKDATVYTALVDALHNDQSYAAQAAAARNLGDLNTPQAFEELQKELAKKPSRHVMAGLVPAIAHYKTPEAQSLLTDLSKTADTDEVRDLAKRSLSGNTGRRR